MARNVLGDPPFPPLVTLDREAPITWAELGPHLERRPSGVSLLVRSERGPPTRGGYFFHLRLADGRVGVHDFSGHELLTLDPAGAVEFVNHATGARFSERMLALSQNQVNLREDAE